MKRFLRKEIRFLLKMADFIPIGRSRNFKSRKGKKPFVKPLRADFDQLAMDYIENADLIDLTITKVSEGLQLFDESEEEGEELAENGLFDVLIQQNDEYDLEQANLRISFANTSISNDV